MIPLRQLVRSSNTVYSKYLSRKACVLSHVEEAERSQWLWFNLIKSYQFSMQFESLGKNLRFELYRLLDNFGYLPESKTANRLESKIPWILKHPEGGVFLPLEIYKLLMQEQRLADCNYLFALLYRLRLGEQKELAGFVGTNIDAQLSISFESNILDMALVLYIWFSRQLSYSKANKKPETRVFSLKGEEIQPARKQDKFCESASNIWGHLDSHFARESAEVKAFRSNIENGRKGFYRSLTLLSGRNSALKEYFRNGWFIPVLPANWRKIIDKIEIITPREVVVSQG